MTDYYSQTVVRTDIPRSAMTGLEFDVLCQICLLYTSPSPRDS